jgi:hypothetical protein
MEHVTRQGRSSEARTDIGAFGPACYAAALEEVDASAGDAEETPRDINGVRTLIPTDFAALVGRYLIMRIMN